MTLNQTARYSKQAVKYGGILIIIVIILRISYSTLTAFINPTQNGGGIKPTQDFGPIPPLIIQRSGATMVTNYSTRLDLIQGTLPDGPSVAIVFPVLKAPYGFLSEDRATSIADEFEFEKEPVKTTVNDRVWITDSENLSVNAQTLNFSYKYNYEDKPALFADTDLLNKSQITKYASGKIQALNITGSFANDLQLDAPQVSLLMYDNEQLKPIQDFEDASAARVDFPRTEIAFSVDRQTTSQFPFVSPNHVGTQTYIVMTHPNLKDKDIINYQPLEINFILWRYNAQAGSTYPLISSRQAWENVQNNPSLFTVYTGNKDLGPADRSATAPVLASITATKAYLAYYDPEIEQDYIQPVWVFEGKATLNQGGELDWAAYVPAVHPNSLKQVEPQQPSN